MQSGLIPIVVLLRRSTLRSGMYEP